MIRVAAIAALATAVAAGLVGAAQADPSAGRIVDRTFSCEAGFVGGLHQVDVAVAFAAEPGSAPQPSATVTRNMFEAALGVLTREGLSVHRGRCSPAKGTVKLSTRGMRGGTAPPLGVQATCETPRRLLLRVRGTFTAPATATIVREFGFPQLVVRGQVAEGVMAVGTRAGRPIAYLALTKKDTARLFTVRTCEED